MSTDTSIGSGTYRLEPLNTTNWMPWKRRMLAVLREQGLESYITKAGSTRPVAGSDGATTASVQEWEKKELKARTRLELAIGDSEMGHIVGADTAYDIWERLCSVKESKGRLGILSTRRALYRSQAQEGFDMVEHINNLRSLKAELALMSNIVSDEDFVMIVISSLPESWDVFTTSYLGAHSTSDETLKAVEFIPILLDEDRRRKSREGGSETSLQARSKKSDMECFNCRRKGHVKKDCWAKGGGKEGKGPRGRRGKERTNQATDNTDLNSAVLWHASCMMLGANIRYFELAAGRAGPGPAVTALEDISAWSQTQSARRAVLHAAQIYKLLFDRKVSDIVNPIII